MTKYSKLFITVLSWINHKAKKGNPSGNFVLIVLQISWNINIGVVRTIETWHMTRILTLIVWPEL